METRQEEALTVLSQIINDFNTSNPDLELALRRCLLACQLLDWSEHYSFFYRELNGYPADIARPDYRQIKGKKIWEPASTLTTNAQWESEKAVYGKPLEDINEEDTDLDVWSGIDWILKASQLGIREETGETKKSHLRSGKSVTLKRISVFHPQSFSFCISSIKRNTFDFASRAYIQLNYGNAIQSIFNFYRNSVEEKFSDLGLSNHLLEIERGLLSSNPESWRSAAYGCRSLLSDVANNLWKDPRPTYEYLRN